MLTERLRDFLQSWCNPDTRLEDVADMLHGTSGAYYADWLESELFAAAQAGEFNPQSLEDLTGLWFAGQPDVDAWLRRIWPMWFRRPYPG